MQSASGVAKCAPGSPREFPAFTSRARHRVAVGVQDHEHHGCWRGFARRSGNPREPPRTGGYRLRSTPMPVATARPAMRGCREAGCSFAFRWQPTALMAGSRCTPLGGASGRRGQNRKYTCHICVRYKKHQMSPKFWAKAVRTRQTPQSNLQALRRKIPSRRPGAITCNNALIPGTPRANLTCCSCRRAPSAGRAAAFFGRPGLRPGMER
jgi:hypothetical protein